ncbi:LOW QUALITY PROTEIN: methyltransferase-like protein 7A [Sus scrofa]|uniref:LOW QUALITY PROTEIN: methyltransferase-like protein 7A n=1 Tax=Sus scrofa TaxID=9823 RepID=UPI000A2B15E4|nr:LOW QUALITY PROTEIN: methyltransferase-like protein 7A [Sus scrofa]
MRLEQPEISSLGETLQPQVKVFTHLLFPFICILAFPKYQLDFLGMWNWICKKWLPYFLARFRVTYNEQIVSKKRELFSNLQEFAGPSGKLSLLELGCGTGTNFKFYPPGCRVACIDPNPNFERFLIKSIAENRRLQFERFVVSTGEDMHQVADGFVDVVVCTLVLCSVKNQDRVLQEVCRVLRPVNALIFVEHIAAECSCWNFSSQQFLSPARPFLLKTCQQSQNVLEGAAFSQPTLQLPHAHWPGSYLLLIPLSTQN